MSKILDGDIRPDLPLLDRLVGRIFYASAAFLAKRAGNRGEIHERSHINAAILVSHSTHMDGWKCAMPGVYQALGSAQNKNRK